MRAGSRTFLQGGVTLIELGVAILLIAILLAIGIPRYRHHVLRVKSVDATRELVTLAQRLDACRKRTGSYLHGDDVPNPCVVLPDTIPEGTYQITGEVAADRFQLTAAPQGSQAADTDCGSFTLNQDGERGITGNGTPQGCW